MFEELTCPWCHEETVSHWDIEKCAKCEKPVVIIHDCVYDSENGEDYCFEFLEKR